VPDRIPYDELAYFHENAEEFGLPYDGPPVVHREAVALGDGRQLSALVWGEAPAELVLLHGGAQNAHTWDTVAMALGRPLVAVDLPGHGHSDGGRNGSADLEANADDIAVVVGALAPDARVVVGMSLGGLTALTVADRHPHLVRSLVLVDVTPGVDEEKASSVIAFVNGPESFASFDEILARTVEFNPTRSESSLRRGILHNALQREDGSWVWRYARHRSAELTAMAGKGGLPDRSRLWDAVGRLEAPTLLARGMRAGSVVGDDDEAELRRRLPSAEVVHFAEAGHSIQGDMPVELATTIERFAFGD
jgi:pimeloyl-ACP methyl ester carboxylesterase